MADGMSFTQKQTDAILYIMADMMGIFDKEPNDKDETQLDAIAQTAMGTYFDTLSDDELMHFGILGMKWGVRRAEIKAHRLERRTMNIEKRSARGDGMNRKGMMSTRNAARRYAYSNRDRVKKLGDYLARTESGKRTFKEKVFRHSRNPKKLAAVKNRIERAKALEVRFSEVSKRLDSLMLDAIYYK